MKSQPNRLEKAKTEYRLALVAYMLHPTREGEVKMKQAAEEYAAALTEHQCECSKCLSHAIKTTHSHLVRMGDFLN